MLSTNTGTKELEQDILSRGAVLIERYGKSDGLGRKSFSAHTSEYGLLHVVSCCPEELNVVAMEKPPRILIELPPPGHIGRKTLDPRNASDILTKIELIMSKPSA